MQTTRRRQLWLPIGAVFGCILLAGLLLTRREYDTHARAEGTAVKTAIGPSSRIGSEQGGGTAPNGGMAPGSLQGAPGAQDRARAVLCETERTSGNGDTVERIRIVRTDFKYPLLRIADTWSVNPATGAWEHVKTSRSVADHVVVRLRPGVSEERLSAMCRGMEYRIRHRLPLAGLYLVAFDNVDVDSVDRHIATLSAAADVVRDAGPDYLFSLGATFPGGAFENLWGMHNTGQSGGTPDADIDAPEAWDVTIGSDRGVVGVIDSGIDVDHPDLAANVWVNPGEIADNGVDDDGNGYVDDARGWDFYHWDNNPNDDFYHGTHVSGTIGARGDDAAGVAGVNWRVRLMVLKAFGPSGSGSDSDVTEALAYAVWMCTNGVNVRITSNSYGDTESATYFRDMVETAGEAGMLLVAAAGNNSGNNDSSPRYPAAYPFSHVIAVAATDHNDSKSGFSNYGLVSVDLGAPGSSIYSTTLAGGYSSKSGTSMACPHVAGAAALLWDLMPDRTAGEIKDAILQGVETNGVTGLQNTVTKGRLNVYNSMLVLEPDISHTPPTNSWNASASYALDARIVPAPLLDTNLLWVAWNLDGNTNSFATNVMAHVSNDLFRALLPTQAVGSVVHYLIHAGNTNGITAADPPSAPASLHTFRVVAPSRLAVAGTPGHYGTPNPDYGLDHRFPSGLTVRASAPEFTPATGYQRYRCDGWTGTQEVPHGGTSNTLSFVLNDTSSFSVLTWIWQKQYALVQTSTVHGLVALTNWLDEGASAQTVAAVPVVHTNGTDYHFSGWYVDGARLPDPTNTALNPVAGISMAAAHTAVAAYVPETTDADGDGMGDWWEHYYFGSTSAVATADSDGDTADNLEEYGDRTDPRDTNSKPAAPVVTVTPLADPQPHPAPFTVTAEVTDSYFVAAVTMQWWRAAGPHINTGMTPGPGNTYSGTISPPGTNGDSLTYFVTAWDAGGRESFSSVHDFDVLYPEAHVSPGTVTGLLMRPGTVTNIVLTVTNNGLGPLNWQAVAAFSDSFDTHPATSWTHGGNNDLWHMSLARPYSGTRAWYCGNEPENQYVNSMDASLVMPEFTVPEDARLSFRHWANFESGSPRQNQYWDAAVVEISTNGGASFEAVTPEGGYPFFVTANEDSPFPAHMPCLGGDGGWRQAAFDLSSYSGRQARVRFRFGSDTLTTDEGWHIDDVLLVPNPYSNAWLTVGSASGTVPPYRSATVTALVDVTGFQTGDDNSFIRLLTDDPLSPTSVIPVSFSVRSPPSLALTSAAQTSTNGEGLVTVSNRLFNVDDEFLGVEFLYSANGGATLTTAFVFNAVASLGAPVISNGQPLAVGSIATTAGLEPATNVLWIEWSSTNGPLAGAMANNVFLQVRAWDGTYWSDAVTSLPFRVDNEPPSLPVSLNVTTHTAGVWSTNSRVGFLVGAANDHDGGGIRDYGYAFASNPGAPAFISGTATQLAITGPPLPDQSNWWLRVGAVDIYGNRGPMTNAGALWIDATPPDSGSAVIAHALSDYGNYAIGAVVTSFWNGFSDNLSGIAGYYVALTDNGGSTNGDWTTAQSAEISGATPDQTNTVYVWARDTAGGIGNAAASDVLLLGPAGDFDGDGLPSGDEEIAGTAADDRTSVLAILAISNAPPAGAGKTVVTWHAVSNRVYGVWYAPSIMDTNWQPLAAITNVPGITGPMAYTDEVPVVTDRFYRVTVPRP